MSNKDPFEGIPRALNTKFKTSVVNEPITLYEGPAIIRGSAEPREFDVVVVYEWTPRAVIVCRFSIPVGDSLPLNMENWHKSVSIEIPSLGITMDSRFYNSHSSGGQPQTCGLAIHQPIEIHPDTKTTRVVFHAINCRDFSEDTIVHDNRSAEIGRIEFEIDDWLITIDRTEDSSALEQSLKHVGGRAITHRVQFARKDGDYIDKDRLSEIASLTEYFVAFLTGTWVHLVLPIGYDGDVESWQMWGARSGSAWTSPHTWSSRLPAKYVRRVFQGFASRLEDEDWKEPIQQTVDWYVQCRNGTAETSIILSQAALELLAWVKFIENDHVILGSSGFENLWASDRIRLLLSQMRVTYRFPAYLRQLAEFSYEGNKTYADGPHAITEIRNGITHPKKAKRDRFGEMGPRLRHQASELGLFYLEGCVLGVCGYFGPFQADPVLGPGTIYDRESPIE